VYFSIFTASTINVEAFYIFIMFIYNGGDPNEVIFNEKNIFHFSISTPNKEIEINDLFRGLITFKEFYFTANKLYGVPDKQILENEWNMALSASANASKYYHWLNNKDEFPYAEYRVILGDSRCLEHEMLNSCFIRYDDPICPLIIPPNSTECCCFICLRTKEEVTPDMLETSANKIELWKKTNPHITFNY